MIHRLVKHIHELRLRCCSFGENLAISIIGILEKPSLRSRMRVRISGHERGIALINASEIFKPLIIFKIISVN